MCSIRSLCAVMVCLAASLLVPVSAHAQESTPSRFEAGAGITAVRTGRSNIPGEVGPTLEGDFNFGRHLALDGAFSWLPVTASQTVTGFFGAKAGIRREHFGMFGKVRPGFFSTSDVLRSVTFNPITIQDSVRFGRLTERALDLGGVAEFYPSRRWLLRWDMGDTLLFERNAQIIIIGSTFPGSLSPLSRTTNHFQFSTSLHYRF